MKTLVASLLIAGIAAPAFAMLGLPYAEDATSSQGEMRITGGITLESDVNLYGGRFAYGVMDGLSLFAGAGLVDPDGGDSEPYFQLGAKFTLPADLPFDIAARAAFGMVSYDNIDISTLNIGALGSKAVDPAVTVYGFAGISYRKVEWSDSWRGSRSNTDTELAIAGGAIYTLNVNLSLFAELAHIDELFISGGARYTF